jgi:predicted enzyme related to lactoylglutathione lyase
MRSLVRLLCCATLVGVVGFAIAATPGAQTPSKTFPYDHIHLQVDAAEGSAWYEKNFGGKRITEAPNRIMYGSTRLMFLGRGRGGAPQPSVGSVIDHLGFSVTDLDAKMKEFEANGVKVVQPARDIPGLFKLAFVEDPWGTRIEVVQDPELLGLHHVHLAAPDPQAMFAFLLDKFGGERTQLKGRLDALRYRAAGFSDVWILVNKGEGRPSQGSVINHIGWRSEGPLAATMAGLKAKGAELVREISPLTLPNGPPINFQYINGPNGLYIELVERPGLKPGE